MLTTGSCRAESEVDLLSYLASRGFLVLEVDLNDEAFCCSSRILAANKECTLAAFSSPVNPEWILKRTAADSLMKSILATLREREAIVISLRFGLDRCESLTLENVGKLLGLTRERIRQIEMKALRKLMHPTRRRRLAVLAELLLELERERTVYSARIPTGREKTLASIPGAGVRRKLSLTDRIYLAMRIIGEPAHFSHIARVHNELFPKLWRTDHNIHGAMGRDERIVWVGMKGIYALREWGYEQPDKDLFETVAEIVEEVYRKTYRPVNVNDVFANIGKYRKLYNRNSVLMALQFNAKLVPASSDSFLPRWATDEDSKAENEDELDQILKKFEPK